MKAAIAIGCVLLATSHACGQVFQYFGDSRWVTAYSDSDDQQVNADTLMPFDATLAAGERETSFAAASQTSRLTPREIFISGGTGDVVKSAVAVSCLS